MKHYTTYVPCKLGISQLNGTEILKCNICTHAMFREHESLPFCTLQFIVETGIAFGQIFSFKFVQNFINYM